MSVTLSEHHTPISIHRYLQYFDLPYLRVTFTCNLSSFTVSLSGFLTKATTLYPLSRASKTVCCPEGPVAPNTEIFILSMILKTNYLARYRVVSMEHHNILKFCLKRVNSFVSTHLYLRITYYVNVTYIIIFYFMPKNVSWDDMYYHL